MIPQFEAILASRTRGVFSGVLRRPSGSFQIHFTGHRSLHVSETISEGTQNAETIVSVAFGASWTSKVIPQFEALLASRTRAVFLGCFGGPSGNVQVNFTGLLYLSETISEQLIVPFSGEGAQWFQHLLTHGLCA